MVSKKKPPTDNYNTCSFCGSRQPMSNLVRGIYPGSYICVECIEASSTMVIQGKLTTREPISKDEIGRVPTPAEIKAKLDEYVIGQDRTKKIVSVAVHNHYKRIFNPNPSQGVELEKSNVLFVGPTGCGKTLIARTLAKILDVPFAIADATTLTEAGYVGEDVENVLLRLIQAANFDLNKAERGIIYIDEIDKIARTHDNPSITRDVSGEGVQQGLLKILEGTTSNVPPQGGRKHPEQEYIKIDTTHILFIAGGTFDGVENVISRRIGKKRMGFNADSDDLDELGLGDILEHIEPEDLMEFGMIPEFIGRFPVNCVIRPLDLKAMVKVLTEPKNALVRQYQAFFEMENARLEFTVEALEEIGKKALAKKTGARALRAIMENLLIDTMYELPSSKEPRLFRITPAMVKGEKPITVTKEKDKSASKTA